MPTIVPHELDPVATYLLVFEHGDWEPRRVQVHGDLDEYGTAQIDLVGGGQP